MLDDLFACIQRLTETTDNVLVSIDGRCGSGKTTLAAYLQQKFSCNVFHMDDFYLPPVFHAKNWENIPAGNMDLVRLRSEILEPARDGQDVFYRTYDCHQNTRHVPLCVRHTPLTIIEGSYSQHPLLSELYDLKIFLTCTAQTQRERLQIREGDYFSMFEKQWIPMEERYFNAFSIEEKADILLHTESIRI